MFEKNSILTLDNINEYIVADKYDENGNTYLYLVDVNNNTNVIFSKLEYDEIVEINDPAELEKVINTVNKHLHDELK